MGFKLGEGNVDGNGMFSKARGGGRPSVSELFLFKGEGGEESEGIIPTFSPGLHTCDPAASRPSYFSHECVFIFFFLFFCTMCVSLSGSRTPLYD